MLGFKLKNQILVCKTLNNYISMLSIGIILIVIFSNLNLLIYVIYFEGMAADVGTLQRMPKIIGSTSIFNELAFTARKFDSLEAKNIGFVNQIYETKER